MCQQRTPPSPSCVQLRAVQVRALQLHALQLRAVQPHPRLHRTGACLQHWVSFSSVCRQGVAAMNPPRPAAPPSPPRYPPPVPLWCTAPPAAWKLLTHFAVSHLLRAHASRFYAARRVPLAARCRRFRFRYFTLCAPRCALDTLHDVCNVALCVVCCLFCCQGICCRVHDAAAAARKLGETIDMWTLLCQCQF